MLMFLIDKTVNARSSLLRATSLYVIEKLFQMVKENG